MLKVLTKADWDESEHPRDEDGKFAFGGGGGDGGDSDTVTVVSDHPGQGYSKEARIKDGKIFTSDVHDAARALHENRKVELDQPRTLSTLITHLGRVANDMKARGEAAPNYNLCNVSIKGTNLFCAGSKDIPRPKMPQLTTEQTVEFRKHLQSLGYKEVEASERSDFLRATQSELNGVKVARVAGELRTQTWPQEKRLIVSRDNYILDGHHLWAAQIANDAEDGVLGDAKTDIARVDIDIITLMDEAKKFGAGYESQNIAVSSGYGPEREMASATPEQFVAARSESGRAAFLSDKSADELKNDNLFLSTDGHTGYALDPKNDLQNLFNNGPKGGGKVALVDAIKNGAETLDAFDSFLPRLYAAHGFVVTGRIKFNDEFAPAGWDYAKDGRPDIVFMRYAGGDRETIEDRVGKFEPYDRSQGSYFTDYDSAKAASRSAGVGKGLVHGLPQLGGGRAEHGGRRQFSEELESPHGRSEETGKRLRVEGSPRRIYVRSSLVEAHRLISKIEASGDIEIVPYDGEYIPGTELVDLREWDESLHPRDEGGRFGFGGGGADDVDAGGGDIAVTAGGQISDKTVTAADVASPQEQKEGVANIKQSLAFFHENTSSSLPKGWKDLPFSFKLKNGVEFVANAETYNTQRGPPKQCYMNATQDALENPDHIYVEGHITTYGLPIEHAWTVDITTGQIYDQTIVPDTRIRGYFGTPFTRDYLRRATLKNKVYGLLDPMNKTIPDLMSGKEKNAVQSLDKKEKDWDESLHPRDEAGRFGFGGGGGDSSETVTTPIVEGGNVHEKLEKLGVTSTPQAKEWLDKHWDTMGVTPEKFKELVSGGLPTQSVNLGVFIPRGSLAVDVVYQNKTGYFSYDMMPKGGTVHADVLRVRPEGAGFGKKVMANVVELFKRNGNTKIELYANIKVGAYAWAKYGFVPSAKQWKDLQQIYEARASFLPEADQARINKILTINDPRAIWAIADDPRGGDMMLGENLGWDGHIDLGDDQAMRRFNAYIATRPKEAQ